MTVPPPFNVAVPPILIARKKEKHMSTNSSLDKKKFPHALEELQQEHWYLTKMLVLLGIICIASLGSLSLAQNLLPDTSTIGLKKTPTAPKYSEGVCDADPSQMAYLSPSTGAPNTSPPNSNSNTSKPKPKTNINNFNAYNANFDVAL